MIGSDSSSSEDESDVIVRAYDSVLMSGSETKVGRRACRSKEVESAIPSKNG